MVEHEVFDLTIHDSRSSQLFNENYNQIKEYQNTSRDPIYCSLQNTILLPFGKTGIRVPLIYAFIQQQLFAFGNVRLHIQGSNVIKGELIPKSNKGYIHLRRVLYILHMLTLIQPNNQNNTQLLTGLKVYPIANYITGITADIEKRRQVILHKLPPKDKEVFNKKMDMILREFDLPRSVSPAPLQVHFPVKHHMPRHASATSASSGHASPRHGSPKSASSRHASPRHVSPNQHRVKTFENIIDAIHTIIVTNKSLIGAFKRSNPSLDIKHFFDNIRMYKDYSDKKMPNDQIKRAMTDIIKEEKIERIKNHVKPLPEQKQLVKLVDILVSHLKKAIATSGGRRRTQKKRGTRKR
jgi:hypothetical protein